MGLAETQSVLARLYTDGAFRERFVADPATVGAEIGLDPEEVRQLAGISTKQLDFFADSLHNKRRGEVAKLLPWTAEALGPRFAVLFRSYSDTPLSGGAGKHRDDAISFAYFLEKHLVQPSHGCEWIADLARYERAWLEMYGGRRRITLRWFRHPTERPMRTKQSHATPEAARRQLSLGVWIRSSPETAIIHRLFKFIS